jgi:hypothetical protein
LRFLHLAATVQAIGDLAGFAGALKYFGKLVGNRTNPVFVT